MTMHSNRTPQTAWQLTSHLAKVYFAFFIATTFSGCTSILSPVSGVPSHRLPPQFLAAPKMSPGSENADCADNKSYQPVAEASSYEPATCIAGVLIFRRRAPAIAEEL